MDRQRALMLVQELLGRLDSGKHEWPLSLIREVNVFGSFARGAANPHDVDIDIEYDQTEERWRHQVVEAMMQGRDWYSPLRRALVGSRRGCEFQFNARGRLDLDLTMLWRAGDSLEQATQRLRYIPVDESAGRAPRHAMLPQFEGLDHWLPRPCREALCHSIESGQVAVERIEIRDATVQDPVGARHIARRWKPASPLFRAANAVLAFWEEQGIDLRQVHLHGKDVQHETTPYFAGFGLRYFGCIPRCLTHFQGKEWIEMVHPTLRQPLACLRIIPLDKAGLTEADWS